MLVSGPTGISVCGRSRSFARDQLDGVDRTPAARDGGGRSGPSRPVSPCTSSADARRMDRAGGRRRRRPAWRRAPTTSSTRIAFAVTLSSVWFPATVVTADSSSSGLARASIRAIASSWPGSQSMITGVRHGASFKRAACSNAAMHLAALLLSAVRSQAPGRHDRLRGVHHHRLRRRHRHGQPGRRGHDLPLRIRHHRRLRASRRPTRTWPRAPTRSPCGRRSPASVEHDAYHYRVVAPTRRARTPGADKTFRTAAPAALPSISSRAATGVTATGATLEACVEPTRPGHRPSASSTAPRPPTGPDARSRRSAPAARVTVVRAAVGGLRPNTRYNFRAVATSAAGVTRGSNRTFTTGKVPTGVAVTPSTVRPIWGSSADDSRAP